MVFITCHPLQLLGTDKQNPVEHGVSEAVFRIDPKDVHPVQDRLGEVAVQQLQRAHADSHEQKAFEKLKEGDRKKRP